MKNCKILLIFLFFIMSSNYLQAETKANEESAWESGGEPWAFLKIGVGARAMGMGGAYVAVADDATAPYWNPAGLGLLKQKTVTAMYVQPGSQGDISGFGGGMHGYLSYCHPTDEFGNLGASINYFKIDDIVPTIATPDGDFKFNGDPENDNEWAFNFSYALSLPRRSPEDQRNPRIFLGTNLRIMAQDFMGYSTKGLGSDLGAIVSIIDRVPEIKESSEQYNPIENLKVGYVLKYNSKRSWKWDETQYEKEEISEDYTDPAALGWQMGISSKILLSSSASERKSHAILAASLIRASEGVPLAIAFGGELKILQAMAIRVGFHRLRESNIFTAGAGLEYQPIQVDYAVSIESLGLKHRMSLSASF